MTRVLAILFLSLGLLVGGSIGQSFGAPQVSISTSKPSYTYGESMSFSIMVANVTGDNGILQIIDQKNQSSGPIPIIISKPVSNFSAPFPFYRTTYAPGTYHLEIQYDGSDAVASFQIVDNGMIAIPPQFKTVASYWVQNQASTKLFGEHISDLLSSGVIPMDGYQDQNMTVIPSWFKNVASWWSLGSVSDTDFGHAIQYLVKSGIMKV